MEKDIKLLLVPDVHGRDFWREPVMANLDKKIVFMGDYVDPFPDEKITGEKVVSTLLEIISLASVNENITLLLGNHDAGYAVDASVCQCRRDWRRYGTISEIFKDDIDLFDVAYETTINKKRFLITHAGIHFDSWIKFNTFIFPKGFRVTAKNLNDMFHSDEPEIKRGFDYVLRDLSYYRGGYESYGSLLWADLREFLKSREYNKRKTIQVVAHTRLKGIGLNLNDRFYCLDCQRVFYIDSKGQIRYYDNDEVVAPYIVENEECKATTNLQ